MVSSDFNWQGNEFKQPWKEEAILTQLPQHAARKNFFFGQTALAPIGNHDDDDIKPQIELFCFRAEKKSFILFIFYYLKKLFIFLYLKKKKEDGLLEGTRLWLSYSFPLGGTGREHAMDWLFFFFFLILIFFFFFPRDPLLVSKCNLSDIHFKNFFFFF